MSSHAIHHVTAIAGSAQGNLDFYAGTLGLRLVKRTVNFDDPGAYHLYFGDTAGTPGTIITFFPWAGAAAGQDGVGALGETSFRVPIGAMDYWMERLRPFGAAKVERFGETVLMFRDPDEMGLALVGVPGIEAEAAWDGSDVPVAVAIRGFHGVRLALAEITATAAVLTDVFGFVAEGAEGETSRFRAPGVRLGGVVDLQAVAGRAARQGRGSVHHLAFRAADDADQAAMVTKLARDHGLQATAQKDRDYFRSVYFRSPGGVLFEIATDVPGFAVDEAADALGTALKLPRFLQPHRAAIEAALPALN